MRTLVHLSDLHFGRVDQTLLNPLRQLIERIDPDVLVVSGDLTQRARAEQFEEARAFLDTLPRPQIIVPGNHDISLYNVFRRFVKPLERYKRYITDDLDPAYIDEEIAVLGVNTARSFTIKDGKVSRDQLDVVRKQLDGLPASVTRIIVAHHPFDLPEHFEEQDLVNRAPRAMQAFSECGVDILLGGHMHASHAGSTAARYQMSEYAALVVQAGTATSTRGRGEVNSFNVLRVEPEKVEIDRYGWDVVHGHFELVDTDKFMRTGNVWTPHNDGLMAAGL
jgi:3',5'-cyclic AMP phosphodiesterase CpdA